MKKRLKSLVLFVWNKIFDEYLYLMHQYKLWCDKLYLCIYPGPKVETIEETLKYVIKNKVSVSRYGDGEMELIWGKDLDFQKYNVSLCKRLIEVLNSQYNNHIVTIPGTIYNMKWYDHFTQKCWKSHFAHYRKDWEKYICKNRIYFNSDITRCYIGINDKSKSVFYFQMLKKIWEARDIVLIEGEKSRLGVGNDLFKECVSIKRLLCPAINAYDFYDDILRTVSTFPHHILILIALGPTATVLAYDLAKMGYQAIDIGHVDIEYEWFLAKVTKKIAIKYKYVNEVRQGGRDVDSCIDDDYLQQIIYKIGC